MADTEVRYSDYKVAYIGMGIMGAPMAANLARKGCVVSVWNRTANRPGVKTAAEAGARVCATIAEAVKDARFVFTCVSDTKDIEHVLTGPGGVSESAEKGAIVIDTSTIGPEVAKSLSDTLKKADLCFLDAPVTGGDIGARNGTLVIMVGGEEADFKQAEPLLMCIGKSATWCGPAGSGQALKLCNQIFCATNMLGLCEAYALAKNFDLDLSLLPDVLGGGAGGSWALQNLGPKIARADLAPGFRIEDMLKDLRLVQENSNGALKLQATQLAEKMFQEAKRVGGENLGTQAMKLAYEQSSL
jgi:3-hydroxyisobutyrate dehydrogenase